MNIRGTAVVLGLLAGPGLMTAAVLQDQTLDAWNQYIHQARSRMLECVRAHGPFLSIDETSGPRSRVRAGEIMVAPVGSRHPKHVPSGLIHDWIGTVFLPGATLDDTMAVVRDYNHYKDYYRPLIIDSKSLGSEGGAEKFSLVVVNKTLFSQVALHSEFDDSYVRLDPRRWYSIGASESVREIEDYGGPSAHELAPNEGKGYIWRLYSLSKFEESDGGVYVEREVMALSRDIPAALRWLVDPIVNRLSRSSLSTSLEQTRQAVLGNIQASRKDSRRMLASHRVPESRDE